MPGWRKAASVAKLDLLAIDDWLLAALTDAERRDLLEVIEDRSERTSTLIASQLPPTAWHAAIGDPHQRGWPRHDALEDGGPLRLVARVVPR